jgi:streptomycin 3"-adenylyltransferase
MAETPYYAVLNICRVLQLMTEADGRVHSKDEGGEWALVNLPAEFHPVIRLALAAYRSPALVSVQHSQFGGEEWDEGRLLALRDYARSRLTA